MIARVFPRRTNQSPTDELSFFDSPGLFVPEGITEVRVSVAFTYDRPRAEWLAKQWSGVAPVSIGGPGAGTVGGEFEPGLYVKKGVVFTSRGCPNSCWFCSVWKRDGTIRELEIKDGWVVQDDNLLACSEDHIRRVFGMLRRQRRETEFAGGLEARLLRDWHIEEFLTLRIGQAFFAYDTPSDLEPLMDAGRRLKAAGLTRSGNKMRCFVLIGGPGDTLESAERRMYQTLTAGFMPLAMLWKDEAGKSNMEFSKFRREWSRPAIMSKLYKKYGGG